MALNLTPGSEIGIDPIRLGLEPMVGLAAAGQLGIAWAVSALSAAMFAVDGR